MVKNALRKLRMKCCSQSKSPEQKLLLCNGCVPCQKKKLFIISHPFIINHFIAIYMHYVTEENGFLSLRQHCAIVG